MEQKYFSGSNSGTGFYNSFAGILPEWERMERFFIIKGGPGVGKSTAMRRVAEQAEKRGETVERFFCSGDPDSLDAIRLVERGILLADGTSPHGIDPVFPGAVEEIINFGEAICREKITKYREEAVRLTLENKRSYARAYAFLGAAAVLEKERFCEVSACVDEARVKACAREMEGEEAAKESMQERRLFLDAITCKGSVSFAKDAAEGKRCYQLVGENKEVFVHFLCRELVAKRKELFLNPLLPNYVSHLALPEQGVFLSAGDVSEAVLWEEERFLKRSCPQIAKQYKKEAKRMIEAAMRHLAECKKIHDALEEVYKVCVDFDRVNEKTQQLLFLLALA